MALDSIFVYICLIRSGSANNSLYKISCLKHLMSRSLPSFICSNDGGNSSKISQIFISFGVIFICPFSIFEISRTSLTSSNKKLPESLIFSRLYFTLSGSVKCVAAISVNPIIAFIGVLMSCAICDINSVFATFALFASSAIEIQLCSRRLLALIICVTYKTSVTVFASFRFLTINLAVCQLLSVVRYSVAMVSSFSRRFASVDISKNCSSLSLYSGTINSLHNLSIS